MTDYIITDEMEVICNAVKAALNVPSGSFTVLNYQYGYVQELNETLQQWENDPVQQPLKFPLVWLAEPYNVDHSNPDLPGGTVDLELFIINKSGKTWKAEERMNANFKPVIYPIYNQLLNQLAISPVTGVTSTDLIKHKYSNRYYFGENNRSVLNDVVDCMRVSISKLPLSEKADCNTFSNI